MVRLRRSRISLEHLGEVLDDRRLDAFGRLVEQQHLGVAGQRARDGELLLLAAGQVAAAPFVEFPQDREQAVDLVRDLALAGDHQAGLDVLLHGHGAEDLRPCGT